MNRIPVDLAQLGDPRFLGAQPRTDQEGKPIVRDGIPVQRVSVLVGTPDGRHEVLDINVAKAEPIRGQELARVRITGLAARPWAIDGRDGVSFSADDVLVLGQPQGDTPTTGGKPGTETKPLGLK